MIEDFYIKVEVDQEMATKDDGAFVTEHDVASAIFDGKTASLPIENVYPVTKTFKRLVEKSKTLKGNQDFMAEMSDEITRLEDLTAQGRHKMKTSEFARELGVSSTFLLNWAKKNPKSVSLNEQGGVIWGFRAFKSVKKQYWPKFDPQWEEFSAFQSRNTIEIPPRKYNKINGIIKRCNTLWINIAAQKVIERELLFSRTNELYYSDGRTFIRWQVIIKELKGELIATN
jgi:hypothetical protein